jgi:hypothetical protein
MIEHADTVRDVFMAAGDPAITADHGKLIRAFRVTWMPIENGAPGIDCQSPFGPDVDVIEHALALLGTTSRRYAAQTLAEAGRILPACLERLQLAPGSYPVPGDLTGWSGVKSDGSFAFRPEHATLLKGAAWTLVDSDNIDAVLEMDTLWPMPYIDGKYPYGDCSYFQLDMAKLLGEPYQIGPDQYAIEDEKKDARLERLHETMLPALQVFLANAVSSP